MCHTNDITPCTSTCDHPLLLIVFSVFCCPIKCLYVLSSVLPCPLRFPNKNDVRFVFTSSCLQESSCFIYVICVCLCIVMSNTYCVVFLFCFSSSCVHYVVSFSGISICYCPSVFSYVYLLELIQNVKFVVSFSDMYLSDLYA